MQRVLRAVLAAGAVSAGPGEFTKRAFLNGKMDLVQAESVMNIISAQGSASLNASRNALKGAVGKKADEISEMLISAAASLAAWADYPEDDVPAVDGQSLSVSLENAAKELKKLIDRCDNGKAVTEGVRTVICGKPNVGKSTLMNLLSGYDRSIVTSVAGTTRDVVEETVRIGDIILRLADTAGIHETEDEVESIGVDIARDRIENADFTLAVFDVSRELTKEDAELLELCRGRRCVAVINKTDLENVLCTDEIKRSIPEVVYISAKNPDSADVLKAALERTLGLDRTDLSQEVLIGERQRKSVVDALRFVNEAIEALNCGLTLDAVNVSIDCALSSLYSLTGKRVTDETVNEVFKRFCVGK
jgi:tRNA modification GTPase